MIAGKSCGANTRTNGMSKPGGVASDAEGCLQDCINNVHVTVVVKENWADASDACCFARCSTRGCICSLVVEGYSDVSMGSLEYGPVQLHDGSPDEYAVLRSMIDPANTTEEPNEGKFKLQFSLHF